MVTFIDLPLSRLKPFKINTRTTCVLSYSYLNIVNKGSTGKAKLGMLGIIYHLSSGPISLYVPFQSTAATRVSKSKFIVVNHEIEPGMYECQVGTSPLSDHGFAQR